MAANTFGVYDGTTGALRFVLVNAAGGVGITPGTGPTDLGKAEDAVAGDGDTGVAVLGVRKDTPASTAGTTGDYASPAQDAYGGTWVALESGGTPVSFSGATAVARLLSAAGTSQDSTLVKNAAGYVSHITGRNNRTSSVYLKLYNKASAPTVGTDVPLVTIEIPASTAFDFAYERGSYFSAGIGFGLTTAAADNSTASVTAGDITCLNIWYE